jgi:hypothetical protein
MATLRRGAGEAVEIDELWFVPGGRTVGEVEGVSGEDRKENSHRELGVEIHGPDIELVEFDQPRRQNHRQCKGEHVLS